MTRKTIRQLRMGVGDKWKKLEAELDNFPTAQSTNYSIRGGTGTVYLASPGVAPIDTGLSSIAGFGFGVVSPTTPDYLVVNCTPGADGTLLCSTTPADATISWVAIGPE
jgi:hypothetical protein